ncbi:MAG TPA: hypothetical protein VN843_31950 [Anaerolineales bacterium]|nr:hypothetical protein [Anaerolineales bacterium]
MSVGEHKRTPTDNVFAVLGVSSILLGMLAVGRGRRLKREAAKNFAEALSKADHHIQPSG